ncbi:MAG: hypothetical protein RIS35_3316, partial [Pseudomonadota bacterium]
VRPMAGRPGWAPTHGQAGLPGAEAPRQACDGGEAPDQRATEVIALTRFDTTWLMPATEASEEPTPPTVARF